MIKKAIIYAFCLVMLLSASYIAKSDSVFACSCAVSSDPESQVESALSRNTVIFTGTVNEIKQPRQQLFFSSDDPVKVTFDVTKAWKGKVRQQTTVYTAISSASCGYESFKVGTAYIVTAYTNEDAWLETGICDLTKPLAAANEEIALLGDGYPPSPTDDKKQLLTADPDKLSEQSEAQKPPRRGATTTVVIAAVLILIAAAILLRLTKRRNNRI